MILFLHRGLLSGNGKEDLDRVLNIGPLYEAWIQTRDLPFVILYPQLAQLDQPAQTVVVSRRSENGPPPPLCAAREILNGCDTSRSHSFRCGSFKGAATPWSARNGSCRPSKLSRPRVIPTCASPCMKILPTMYGHGSMKVGTCTTGFCLTDGISKKGDVPFLT